MTEIRRTPVVVALLVALVAGGCVPKVEQPSVWLTRVSLVSLGISGGVIDVELGVFNPNTFPLEAAGLTYDVDLEAGDGWLDLTDGNVHRTLRVEPGDTVRVVVPVEFGYRELGRAIRQTLDRGTVGYRVRGAVAVEEPIVREIRYRHSGTVTPGGARQR